LFEYRPEEASDQEAEAESPSPTGTNIPTPQRQITPSEIVFPPTPYFPSEALHLRFIAAVEKKGKPLK
jgi:hypothetical protein